MKIALAQINPTIGNIDQNAEIVQRYIRDAASAGAAIVAFPEQTLIGYPAKDLLLRREIVERNVAALHRLAADCDSVAALVGFAEPNDRVRGRPVFNSAALLHRGRILATWRKRLLPTYDVFDEARYFEPAGPQSTFELPGRPGLRLGITICEDMLSEPMFGRELYDCDPVAEAATAGANVLLNLSASPYFLDKHAWRIAHMAGHAKRCGLPVLYVNQVGGNDELLFDGASCAISAEGGVLAQAGSFREQLLVVDLAALAGSLPLAQTPTGMAGLHEALILGVHDYARKCGFTRAVIGLSGGIDSAVVAALAARALGRENVHGVAMPSRFSSAHSLADARALATNLGIQFSEIPIEPVHAAFENVLTPHFAGRPADVTEENVQARIRGALLMGLSNKFGSLLLTTGNKSEVAVGYCTLYGDMCGGLAVISDVPKTMVYSLARWINADAGRALIPSSSLSKPPSAELRPNQTDQDTLPHYEVLDAILERYEEQMHSPDEIIAAGFDPRIVHETVRRIRLSEYKRQQAAPGLKVTSRAFGFGRRMPIAAKY